MSGFLNEGLLIASLILIYGMVLVAYRLFGRQGLYVMTAISAILANIEVGLLISAFGLEQTLGNVLFASSFLITDILSEVYGRVAARRAVAIGVLTSVFFLVLAQMWLAYSPLEPQMGEAFSKVFGQTPRILMASLAVYAVAQVVDVVLYHFWWRLTERKTHNRSSYLWLRNNGSTLISQLVNTALFTLLAFYGTYPLQTLVQIFWSSYVIFIVTSLLDTPVLYWARRLRPADHPSLAPAQQKD